MPSSSIPLPLNHGPLDGYRVLDFTNILSGPYSTRILADLGAEVIKIELPFGDHARHLKPFVKEVSSYFAHLYAGKKSVTLDLKTTAGRQAAFELGKRSDVIVENWRPGVAKRLGLDYASFSVAKSDIVYCSISGYGQNGPDAGRPAYAAVVEAQSGYTHAQMKYDKSERPQNCGLFLGDTLSAVWAFAAIQTALLTRERTGRGGHIDLAMLDAMLFAAPSECQEASIGHFTRRFYPPLKATDGHVIVAPSTQSNFEQLARTIGRSEWLQDTRFNSLSARYVNWDEQMRLIEEWTSQRTAQECESILQAGGVPCSRYRSYGEAMQEPQIKARGTFAPMIVEGVETKVTNLPFQIPGVPIQVKPWFPKLGQHNTEVLRDILDYTDEQIKACGTTANYSEVAK